MNISITSTGNVGADFGKLVANLRLRAQRG